MHVRPNACALALAVALVLNTVLAGCKGASDIAGEAQDKAGELAGEAKDKAGELADRAKDRASQVADETTDRASQLAEEAKNHAKARAAMAAQLGKSWKDVSVAELRGRSEKLVLEHSKDIDGAKDKINATLGLIARDPDTYVSTEDKVLRMGVLLLPVIGPTKRYADARALHLRAQKTNDSKGLQAARREVLIAAAEMGFDIMMFGVAGKGVDFVATGANQALTALKISRSIAVLSGEQLSAFDGLLDQVLVIDGVAEGIDSILEM